MTEKNMIRWEQDSDGIVTLTMDDPDQGANTMNATFTSSLAATVARLEAERESITGVILTSAKKTFFAGGDLHLLIQATPADAAALEEGVDVLKSYLRRLETLGRPVVAAVNGAALGGGLEIALACHHRVALNTKGSEIGLPEVTLGLLPGGGGVARTVRMFGLQKALMEVLLQGQRRKPAQALEVGVVDELVETPEEMLNAAKAWIKANPEAAQPWDVKGYKIPGGTPSNPKLAAVLPAFPANLRKQIKGAPMPAPHHIMAAAVEGAQVDFGTAQKIETQYFADLATGQVSKNMIQAFFFDLQHITKGGLRPAGIPKHRASKVAIIGAGMMGAGIAYVCARNGIEAVLKDVSLEAAEKGKDYSRKLLDKAVSRGRMTQDQRSQILDRIVATDNPQDAKGADLLIEAVFEDADLKRKVYAEIEPVLAEDAVLGSNTSTLPISGLAGAVSRPADFIGMHFFSPVDKMPLLEIIAGEKTSDATIAKAIDIALQIKKTPIVVNDSRGFFTSRVIGTFLGEAAAMLGEGLAAPSIEQAALQAGYPTGPLALLDEVSLTLARSIRMEASKAAADAGVDFPDHPSFPVIDQMVIEFGRGGRAAGAGFYDYVEGARQGLWSGLVDVYAGAQTIPFIDMQERMLFIEALETIKCRDEGVLRSVAEANIGSIFGIGFPPWSGGVLQYVNGYVGGAAGFVERSRELATRYGARFAPPRSLVELAESGGTYS
ncbi:MAG: 3-hydroxyacyl-CoA dehydrogenase NAD-binding domain-containing protein [Candidatus Nanopelagicales bacterium]|nr:3-hydroxyacyl-CoA dehydrogenase NAD-binding domain-containing protein [Candidatus Nanopelagicales bacterium]MDZ4248988.1 3-hydroxyacyl-CoA dehydrogenase NAD-binding domain-containing protein [Candidatus Nanopelagicales bacterium]